MSTAKKRRYAIKPVSKALAFKSKHVSHDEGDAAVQSRVANHTVKRIQSRTGWYVDYVELEYRDGTFERHGNGSGGYSVTNDALQVGETIVEVAQQGWSHGYLGSALIIKLSTGREIKIAGSNGQNN